MAGTVRLGLQRGFLSLTGGEVLLHHSLHQQCGLWATSLLLQGILYLPGRAYTQMRCNNLSSPASKLWPWLARDSNLLLSALAWVPYPCWVYVCTCENVHAFLHMRELTLVSSSVTFHFISRDRVELHDPRAHFFPILGLETCAARPSFWMGNEDPKSGLHIAQLAFYGLSHPPPSLRAFYNQLWLDCPTKESASLVWLWGPWYSACYTLHDTPSTG